MSLQAAAFATYALTFVALGAAGVTAQWLFFRKYATVFPGGVQSDDELVDQFFENPFRFATRGPSVVASRLHALFNSILNRELEGMRRRSLVLFGATAAWMVVGAPATFIMAALVAVPARQLGPLPGVAFIAAGIGNLIWGLRRGRVSASLLIAVIAGVYVGGLFVIGALARS